MSKFKRFIDSVIMDWVFTSIGLVAGVVLVFTVGVVFGYGIGMGYNPNMKGHYHIVIDNEYHYCYRGYK